MMNKESENLIQKMADAIKSCNDYNTLYEDEIFPIESQHKTAMSELSSSIAKAKTQTDDTFEVIKNIYTKKYRVDAELDSRYPSLFAAEIRKLTRYNAQTSKLSKHLVNILKLATEVADSFDIVNSYKKIPSKIAAFIKSLFRKFAIVMLWISVSLISLSVVGLGLYNYLSQQPFACDVGAHLEDQAETPDDFPIAAGQYWEGRSSSYRPTGFGSSYRHNEDKLIAFNIVDESLFIGCAYWPSTGTNIMIMGTIHTDIQLSDEYYEQWEKVPRFNSCIANPDVLWFRYMGIEHLSNPGSSVLFIPHYGCISDGIISGFWNRYRYVDDPNTIIPGGNWELERSRIPMFRRDALPFLNF